MSNSPSPIERQREMVAAMQHEHCQRMLDAGLVGKILLDLEGRPSQAVICREAIPVALSSSTEVVRYLFVALRRQSQDGLRSRVAQIGSFDFLSQQYEPNTVRGYAEPDCRLVDELAQEATTLSNTTAPSYDPEFGILR